MRRTTKTHNSVRTRRAALSVWAAFCLIMTIAFVAFSLDWGYMVVTESELQNAADAGALSAARALSTGRSQAIAAGQLWASKNFAAGQSVTVASANVEVGQWNDTTATFTALAPSSTLTPNAVRVTCSRTAAQGNALQLFYGPMLGTNSADLSTRAIAKIKTSRCGLINGINSVTMSGSSYTDSYKSANGSYSSGTAGVKGHVCSNGDITLSSTSAIRGDAHPGPGKLVKSTSTVGVLGSTSALTTAMSFPAINPGTAATVNNNTSIPTSQNGLQPLNAANAFALSLGDSVTLSPGTYYFSKLTLTGGSTLRTNGRTIIYVTGDVDMSGGSFANLTLQPSNLELYPMGTKCVISGTSEFYGLVYAPNSIVSRSGGSHFYGAIIAGTLALSGSGGIHVDESLDTQFLGGATLRSALVQ